MVDVNRDFESSLGRDAAERGQMRHLAANWWAVALRGVAAVIFGLVTLVWPGISLGALVLLFGAYAVVEGVFNLLAAFRAPRAGERWWPLALEGVVSVLAGIAAFTMPALTALALVWLVGAWAFVTGILEIVAAVRLRRHITNEWWLILGGVASIAFGVLLAIAPAAGAIVLVLWIGAYAVVFGALMLALAFRLRRWEHPADRQVRRAA